MCLIDIQHYVRESFLQLYQFCQRSHITVHAEHAFGHDNHPFKVCSMFLQQALQLPVILMTVADASCRRQTDAVYQAGMYQLIGKYQRMHVCHCRQDARIQMITATERQGTFTPEPFGKQSFQLLMHIKVSRQ